VKYLPLLKLSIKHHYYDDGYSRDFSIKEDEQTHQLLLNHRCILKQHSTGLTIYQAVDNDNKPFISIPSITTFRFNLQLVNTQHMLFTNLTQLVEMENLAEDVKARWPVYTNKNQTDTKELKLIASETAQPEGIFANIEILIDDSIKPDHKDTNHYQIAFVAKSAYWEYYFVTDKEETNPDYIIKQSPVQNSQTNNNNQSITFKKESPPTNAVMKILLTNHPNKVILYFVSEQAVRCNQLALKNIQVLRNDERLMDNLANPSLHNANQHIKGQGANHTVQDTFFHIVKNITHLPTTGI